MSFCRIAFPEGEAGHYNPAENKIKEFRGNATVKNDLGLGLPLCLFGGQLLFGREWGSCFVWVPKPKGEEKWGRREWRLPKGTETFARVVEDAPGEGGRGNQQFMGEVQTPGPPSKVTLLPGFVKMDLGNGETFEGGKGGRGGNRGRWKGDTGGT